MLSLNKHKREKNKTMKKPTLNLTDFLLISLIGIVVITVQPMIAKKLAPKVTAK